MAETRTIDNNQAWKNYWQEIHDLSNQQAKLIHSVWDSDPAIGVAEDMRRFQPYFNRTLPVIDVGCGNGRQTHYLAQHYKKVIGVDVAAAAIVLAKQHEGAKFIELDMLSTTAVEKFHHSYGDVNLYMRGVLHALDLDKRQVFAKNLSILLGDVGVLYLIEVGEAIKKYKEKLAKEHGVPHQLKIIYKNQIYSDWVNQQFIKKLFPENQFIYLADGDTYYPEVHVPLNAENTKAIPWCPPLYFAIIRRKTTADKN